MLGSQSRFLRSWNVTNRLLYFLVSLYQNVFIPLLPSSTDTICKVGSSLEREIQVRRKQEARPQV